MKHPVMVIFCTTVWKLPMYKEEKNPVFRCGLFNSFFIADASYLLVVCAHPQQSVFSRIFHTA
jgi:hypothetical protein